MNPSHAAAPQRGAYHEEIKVERHNQLCPIGNPSTINMDLPRIRSKFPTGDRVLMKLPFSNKESGIAKIKNQ